MKLETITEDPHVARREFLAYREAVRGPAKVYAEEAYRELREIDEELMRAYRELAKGVTLLRLSETIAAGGITVGPQNDQGWHVDVPRLGIARATAREVFTHGLPSNGDFHLSWARTPSWRELSWSKRNSVRLDRVFEADEQRSQTSWNSPLKAIVPVVPARLRPEANLDGYHVLFEAEWTRPPEPADPALLKHIGGDLWAVVATWDLTPLEAAVLGQR